jgi:hypothetical protein
MTLHLEKVENGFVLTVLGKGKLSQDLQYVFADWETMSSFLKVNEELFFQKPIPSSEQLNETAPAVPF